MRSRTIRVGRILNLLAVAVVWAALLGVARAETWPRFRGENGSGVSAEKGLPKTWSTGDYAWNIELPGEGHSSPVIWDDRLFLSTAVDEGAVRYLICLDAKSGGQIWSQPFGFNRSQKHAKSSWASATPTTDGERVYVAFADKEKYLLSACDFDGNLVWQRDLGPYESQHGQGASPIVFEDLLIVPNDQDGPSSVVALNRFTGDTVWSLLRSNRMVAYATPLIAQKVGHDPQLICSGTNSGVTSIDPRTGNLNWMSGELPARCVASPIFAGDLVIQQCGGGGVGQLLVAIDPFKEDEPRPGTAYTRSKNLPYVPTPVCHGDHVYLWNDNGVVNCMETATGNNIWTKRVGGKFTGSPICVDGTLYIISEEGNVVVLAASPEFQQYGEMPLNDPSHSTPAFANGRLYLRTFHRLACLETHR